MSIWFRVASSPNISHNIGYALHNSNMWFSNKRPLTLFQAGGSFCL